MIFVTNKSDCQVLVFRRQSILWWLEHQSGDSRLKLVTPIIEIKLASDGFETIAILKNTGRLFDFIEPSGSV
jgi:hypothetical protein